MQQCHWIKSAFARKAAACLLLLAWAAVGRSTCAAAPMTLVLPATADGAQIQKALDGLPPHGEVLLSPGTYEISQPLCLRHDYETLRGSGPATVLHLANGANCPVVILGPPMIAPLRQATHLCLANLMIDGNRKNQKVERWRFALDGSEINNNGVQVWDVTDAEVAHVTCCRCRSGGMVTASVRRLQVNDFDAYDNQYDGLACYETEQSHFDDLRLHDNLAAGISLDLDFDHNYIKDATLSCNDLGIFMRDSRSNSFCGLTISKSHHDGVFMAPRCSRTGKVWHIAPRTACVGNSFESLKVDDCGGKAFQVNDASCINNVILGAHFLRNILGGLCQPASHPVTLQQITAGR